MVKQEKIFCNIEPTKNHIFLLKVINRDVIIAQPGQDMFPELDDTLQEKSKCSTDSTSALAESTGWCLSHAKTKQFFVCKDNTV